MKPDIEIWKKFYELAVKVREQKPWQLVHFDNLIMVKVNRKTYYCNIMGEAEFSPCIAIYTGKKGLEDCYAMLDGVDEGWNGAYLAGNQDCLICYYGDRTEMPDDQMDIVHAVKPGFRGKGKWIFCKHVEPRLYPYTPTNTEMNIMIRVFEGLLYGIEKLPDIQLNWSTHYLCVSFKTKDQMWETKAVKQPDSLSKYEVIQIDNPRFGKQLKRCPRLEDIWFVDVTYLFIPMDDEKGRLINPLLFMMFNLNTELIEDMTFIDPDEPEQKVIVNAVVNHILNDGIPKGIVTRCPTVYYTLLDICSMLEIELMGDFDGEAADLINEIIDGFINFAGTPNMINGLLN